MTSLRILQIRRGAVPQERRVLRPEDGRVDGAESNADQAQSRVARLELRTSLRHRRLRRSATCLALRPTVTSQKRRRTICCLVLKEPPRRQEEAFE